MKWTPLKRLLLLFWAVWLSLVVVFNATDALRALGVLPESFAYASGNYQTILDVLAPFRLPATLGGVLFASVIVWEAVCAGLYWWCGLTFTGTRSKQVRAAHRDIHGQPGLVGRVPDRLRSVPHGVGVSTGGHASVAIH